MNEEERLRNIIKEMWDNLYALYWWDSLSWSDGTPKHDGYEHIPDLIKRIKEETENGKAH